MRLTQKKFLLLTACLFLLSSLASAEVIRFNSLPGNDTPIPNGFAGMDWTNFYDVRMDVTGGAPMFTFATDDGVKPAWFTSTRTFSFASAMLGTMGAVPVRLEVVGLLNGKVVDQSMLTLTSSVPVQETFNWAGIDGVRFVPIVPQSVNEKPFQFALSQLVINAVSVPEPTSMLLLGSGLGMLCIQARKLRGRK